LTSLNIVTIECVTLVRKMKLQVVLEPSDEGGYTVYVPALPGCISEGENVDEALENIKEAIELYLEPVATDITGNQDLIVRELVI
jgi:predicted RNase H-like HicB family nuclease